MSESKHDPVAPDKICTLCGERKFLEEFRKERRRLTGRTARCKSCLNIYATLYRDKNKERSKLWYQRNRTKVNEKTREWQKQNNIKLNEAHRIWYERNRDRITALKREYRNNNIDKFRERGRLRESRRRALKRAIKNDVISQNDIAEILKMQRDRCAICRKLLHGVYHIDHIKPLSRGGLHIRKNLQAACPTCNRKKGAKDQIDFMQELGRLL